MYASKTQSCSITCQTGMTSSRAVSLAVHQPAGMQRCLSPLEKQRWSPSAARMPAWSSARKQLLSACDCTGLQKRDPAPTSLPRASEGLISPGPKRNKFLLLWLRWKDLPRPSNPSPASTGSRARGHFRS